MRVNAGTVHTVRERFVDVMLKNPTQLIKDVVKLSPLNLDEREQKPKIKIGTEVLVLTDDWNNNYILGSISQGIVLIDSQTARVEGDETLIYGDSIHIMGADGDNTATVEKAASTTDIWTKKIKIRNDSDDIIQLLLDFMDAMGTCLTGGAQVPHNKAAEVMALKAKLQAFKE
ncbi:MAG: hypothetical protein ACWGHH_06595 [Sulfurovaceae bacterium]